MKKTKNTLRIAPCGINALLCKSFLSKMKGMMFARPAHAVPLLFIFRRDQSVPIHMWFVFFPLLVIWIDEKKRIVDFKVLQPFSAYNPKKKAKYVVEIPLSFNEMPAKKLMKHIKKGKQLRFSA